MPLRRNEVKSSRSTSRYVVNMYIPLTWRHNIPRISVPDSLFWEDTGSSLRKPGLRKENSNFDFGYCKSSQLYPTLQFRARNRPIKLGAFVSTMNPSNPLQTDYTIVASSVWNAECRRMRLLQSVTGSRWIFRPSRSVLLLRMHFKQLLICL